MIFVSFGNAPANQSFTRMAEAIDKLGKETEERVLVQTGNYDTHKLPLIIEKQGIMSLNHCNEALLLQL